MIQMRLFIAILMGLQAWGLHAQVADGEVIRQKYEEVVKKLDARADLLQLKAERDNARKAYDVAWEAAMEKEAPGLLEKYRSIRILHPAPTKSGYETLSDEEKKRLATALVKVADHPALKAARIRRNDAKTEDERKAAEAEYKSAQRLALLEASPELKSLVNKVYGTK